VWQWNLYKGWSGYRFFDVADMVANSLGVLLGWWLSSRWLSGSLLHVDRVCHDARNRYFRLPAIMRTVGSQSSAYRIVRDVLNIAQEMLKQLRVLLLELGPQGHGIIAPAFRTGLHTVVL